MPNRRNDNDSGCGCGCLVMILAGLTVVGACNYTIKSKVRHELEEQQRKQRAETYNPSSQIERKLDSIDYTLQRISENISTNDIYLK